MCPLYAVSDSYNPYTRPRFLNADRSHRHSRREGGEVPCLHSCVSNACQQQFVQTHFPSASQITRYPIHYKHRDRAAFSIVFKESVSSENRFREMY